MVPLDEAPPAPKAHRAARSRCRRPRGSTSPAGREILFAGLYWSANVGRQGHVERVPRELARLRGPGGTYTDVTGTVLAEPTDNASRQYYQSFADVTELVAARRCRATGRSPTSP